MEWKVGKDLKIFSAYPYRAEKVRDKYKLYRYTALDLWPDARSFLLPGTSDKVKRGG